ncbi:hypothetical protein BDV95DRAFT_491140 [Massariosphaeria phaeospora]|uniref:Rhodopsin domain-containing protein n=1 Tax=Massariosphaeria phaeospora TaxID=100035 RepID=A0A7C8IH74_9PLEO|nr:hypothetical protein BDV95DRAFT_491140 [Massariosphaeria phaeospora]
MSGESREASLGLIVSKAIVWTLTALAGLLTAGRLVMHWRKNRRLRWDDFFNGVGFMFLLGWTVTYQVFVPSDYAASLYKMGEIDEPPVHRDANKNFQWSIANMFFFWLAIYAVKASFLALYWQIFAMSQGFRVAWWATTSYVVVSFVATMLAIFLRCGAAADFHNLAVCSQRTRSMIKGLIWTWCSMNILGDLLLMILPIVMLRGLHMRRSQKLGLAVIFGLVSIDIAFDVLRGVHTAVLDLQRFPEQNVLWTALEPSVAVIVCALPCYRGLFSTRVQDSQGSHATSFSFSKIFRTFTHSSQRSDSLPSECGGSFEHKGPLVSDSQTALRKERSVETVDV